MWRVFWFDECSVNCGTWCLYGGFFVCACVCEYVADVRFECALVMVRLGLRVLWRCLLLGCVDWWGFWGVCWGGFGFCVAGCVCLCWMILLFIRLWVCRILCLGRVFWLCFCCVIRWFLILSLCGQRLSLFAHGGGYGCWGVERGVFTSFRHYNCG